MGKKKQQNKEAELSPEELVKLKKAKRKEYNKNILEVKLSERKDRKLIAKGFYYVELS